MTDNVSSYRPNPVMLLYRPIVHEKYIDPFNRMAVERADIIAYYAPNLTSEIKLTSGIGRTMDIVHWFDERGATAWIGVDGEHLLLRKHDGVEDLLTEFILAWL